LRFSTGREMTRKKQNMMSLSARGISVSSTITCCSVGLKVLLLLVVFMTWDISHLCCYCLEPSSLPSITSAVEKQNSRRIARVVSTNKNGGHATTFSFSNLEEDPTSSTSSAQTPAATRRRRPQERIRQLLNVRRSSNNFWTTRLKPALQSTFLPAGYPLKLPPKYLQYCVWSWIQDLSTQLRGVLATQRILEGVGVGRADATALSALLNFIVRDGCGMLASLLFTAAAASRFQTDVKRWRLLADVMVDIGITLEVAAPQVPRALFLPMISIASMCKAICGVAAGACGGAINVFWSSNGGDISDISAKFGAQHTVTGSLGLIFAAVFARSMASVQDYRYIWMLYLALTALHIFANIKCMRLIAFDSFNTVRFNMVVTDFLRQWKQQQLLPRQGNNSSGRPPPPLSLEASTMATSPISVDSPVGISKKEPLFFFVSALPRLGMKNKKTSNTHCYSSFSSPPGRRKLQFGVSFNDFAKQSGKSHADLQQLLLNNRNKNSYWITAAANATTASHHQTRRRRRSSRSSNNVVTVALASNASPLDIAKAYFHALVLLLDDVNKLQENGDDDGVFLNMDDDDSLWASFCKHCQRAGWDLDKTQLQTRGYEIVVVVVEDPANST
jgi:Vitamin B6 photo-protection and homoeostasis